MTEPQLKRLRGSEALPYVDDIGRLRIEVFREYPYLYDGDLAYEAEYLASYFSCPDSIVVLAIAGNRVVGASTGLPMIHAERAWQEPLAQSCYAPSSVFYFGESVLLKTYRRLGLGHRFFDERESFAASIPGIAHTMFCAVVRPPDHPRRPADYRSNESFWNHRGYARVDGLVTSFSWKDLDEDTESHKPMAYWVRSTRS